VPVRRHSRKLSAQGLGSSNKRGCITNLMPFVSLHSPCALLIENKALLLLLLLLRPVLSRRMLVSLNKIPCYIPVFYNADRPCSPQKSPPRNLETPAPASSLAPPPPRPPSLQSPRALPIARASKPRSLPPSHPLSTHITSRAVHTHPNRSCHLHQNRHRLLLPHPPLPRPRPRPPHLQLPVLPHPLPDLQPAPHHPALNPRGRRWCYFRQQSPPLQSSCLPTICW